MRPRVNQPVGYRPTGGRPPSYFYGRRHDYIFYPVAWVDSSSGKSYESGYYDENGNHYDSVAVKKDGKYDNVVCHCPYCGQDTVMTLDAETAAAQSLQCRSCGGPMEIKSALDDYVSGAGTTSGVVSYEEAEAIRDRKRKKRRFWIIAILLVFLLLLWSSAARSSSGSAIQSGYSQNVSSPDYDLELFGETIYLRRLSGNAYEIGQSSSGADKVITWSDDDECYYDEQSDCYLWYNYNLDPAIWQYWYEGISSDYDSGWMEHGADGWFIETSSGWIELPEEYDADALWYIDD